MCSSHNSQEDDAPGPRNPIVVTPVTSWGTEVSLSDVAEQDESSLHLRARSIGGTTDTGSCTVYDGGDKAQLKSTGRHVKEQPSQQQRSSPTAQTYLISHAGDRFQGSTEPPDRSSAIDIDPHDDGSLDDGSLDVEKLVCKSWHHLGIRDKRFLPFDMLDQIVTKDRVYKELRSHLSCSDSQVEAYAEKIWGTCSLTVTRQKPIDERSSTHADQTTRRKLFTILAYMNKLDLIPHFIESEIYDRHLPFTFTYNNEGEASVAFTLGDTTSSTDVFRDWNAACLDQFDTLQWRLLSPFFSFTSKPHHYVLPYDTILPFNEKDDKELTGGFGEVRKITIHHAHYHDSESKTRPSQGTDGESPPFARKKLFSKIINDFTRERNIPRHPSLIRLLASYEWRGDYYLIFPWADGNLLDFWELHPQPAQPSRPPELILWFSKQCLSLVQGLDAIHNSRSFWANKAHGRHGDLKPHNILWFKENEEGESSLGNFKYCDFGVAAFHSTESVQESHGKYARSVTYAAPESTITYKVGQSYDIFSLGCVLLEFVTWYLGGWESVQTFSEVRLGDDKDGYSDSVKIDSFYDIFPFDIPTDGKGGRKATLKRAVPNEFDNLRRHPLCVDYLIDLLDVIEKQMIRMNPEKRVVAQDLVSQLSTLDQHCREDPNYASKKTKDCPRRADTDLSSLVERSMRERGADSVRKIPGDGSTFPKSIAHEQEHQTKPAPRPTVLHEESTLVQTEGLDTDAVDRGRPKETQLLQDSLEPRAATSQGGSCRSEDVTAAGSFVSAVVDQEPDPERKPSLKRPSQELDSPEAPGEERPIQDIKSTGAPGGVWSTFCRLICFS